MVAQKGVSDLTVVASVTTTPVVLLFVFPLLVFLVFFSLWVSRDHVS